MRNSNAREEDQRDESLESAEQRFAEWRERKGQRGRIPKALWQCAVEQARVHGVNRTAKALGLKVSTLKAHMQRSQPSGALANPLFVELTPPTLSGCTVEFVQPRGTRMRIELAGTTSDTLRLLADAFLRSAR